MRLTLRTLLAWRDQTLSPADRPGMDAKVAASAAAHVLSDRIDRAIADDTLPPPHGHAAADPNAVAEYLDNVLPAAALDGFERACLQGDDLLAEVAASHRLLAEVNLDPRVLPMLGRAERARLLAAFRARAEVVARAAAEPPNVPLTTTAAPSPVTPLTPDAIAVRRSSADMPPARAVERSSRAAWLLAVSALLLLGALTGVLAWSVGRGRLVATRNVADGAGRPAADAAPRPPFEPAKPREPAAPVVDLATTDGDDAAADPRPVPPPPEAGAAASDPAPLAAAAPRPDAPRADGSDSAAPLAPSPPPVEPTTDVARPAVPPSPPPTSRPSPPDADGPPAAPALPPPTAIAAAAPPAAATVPFGDALAIAARPAAAPAVVMPTLPLPPGGPPAEPPAEPADAAAAVVDVVAVIGDDPLLVSQADPGADGPQAWMVARAGDRPPIPTRLLAPASCRPVLEIDGVRMLLMPGTVGTLRRDEAGLAWLSVDIGAVVVVGAPGPSPVRLSAEGLDGVATTLPGAPLGFEVVRTPVRGAGDPAAAVPMGVLVHATGAAVPWRQTAPPPTAPEIPAGATLVWAQRDDGVVRITRREHTPGWLASLEPGDAFDRAARSALGAVLVSGDPAEPALERLTGDRRSERRIAAAATLSLIGRHEPLASLLVEDGPRRMLRDEEWRRLERTAVPRALALGPPESEAFTRALVAAAPAGTGPFLARLAGGGDPAALDAADRAGLVDALESPWLVVRRSAWHTLLDLDPPNAVDRLRYRPDRAAALNADGVRWWRERLGGGRSGTGG